MKDLFLKAPLSVQQPIVSGVNDTRETKMNELFFLSSRSKPYYWEDLKKNLNVSSLAKLCLKRV